MLIVFYILLTDKSYAKNIENNKRIFYISLVSLIVSLAMNSNIEIVASKGISKYFYSAFSGVLLFAGNIFLAKGIKGLGSAKTALLNILEPVISLLFSTLLFKYNLDIKSSIGSLLIVLSLLPVIFDK